MSHSVFVLSSSREIDDVIIYQIKSPPISILHLNFDADIQIPETSLQALFPSFPLSRPHPQESLLAGYCIIHALTLE